jgi:hypothetical protein
VDSSPRPCRGEKSRLDLDDALSELKVRANIRRAPAAAKEVERQVQREMRQKAKKAEEKGKKVKKKGGEGRDVNEFGPEAILNGDVGDDVNNWSRDWTGTKELTAEDRERRRHGLDGGCGRGILGGCVKV